MAGVDSGANRGQLRDTRKALFRSPDEDENNKTPGENSTMQYKMLHLFIQLSKMILNSCPIEKKP